MPRSDHGFEHACDVFKVLRGGTSVWDPRVVECPYCQSEAYADYVDVGVGMLQCGPYHCYNCGASEVDSQDTTRKLHPDEARTGFYLPGTPCGPTTNTIGGIPVSHTEAKEAYAVGLLDPWGPKTTPGNPF